MLAVGVLGLDGVFLGFLAWHRHRWTLALLAGASFIGVALVLGAWRRHQRILDDIIREREALAREARTLRELGAGRSSQR
ncbi:MAG: hypothetical protein ABJD11_07890 [Gemmatimonadota bacterium]